MDIINEIIQSLESGERPMLATILSTDGSTPASALSKMLIKEGGKKWIGTIGGGCVEGEVLEEAIRLYGQGKSKHLSFELNETNLDQGLICGGKLEVLLEPISSRDIPLFKELKSIRDEGDDCILATLINQDGSVKGKQCFGLSEGWRSAVRDWILPAISAPGDAKNAVVESVTESIEKAHKRQETERLPVRGGELILEPVGGRPGLIIFGGGHVSKYISRSAAMVGFRVTVVDDRPEYANAERFPEADKTFAAHFADAVAECGIKSSTYVVIVTRGHRSDEEILSRVVDSPAKYIGMIGSRRKVLTTYEHLVASGTKVELLKRVHAPIGIEIGAATAEEIGVSVVAQLIAVRRGEIGRQENKSDAMAGMFEKIKDLDKKTGGRRQETGKTERG